VAERQARLYDIVAFDMDGVLVDYRSCWTWIHDHFGVDNEASLDAFLEDRIDDMEFMRRDIALWKERCPSICMADLRTILEPLPINPGLGETISALQRRGIRTAIISGGLDIVAERIAAQYGFDDCLANGVQCDHEGKLTGEGLLRVELKNKAAALQSLLDRYGIAKQRAACVGDSFIDIAMFENCGLSIAFNPSDEVVAKKATYVVRDKSLSAILPYIIGAAGGAPRV